MPKFIIYPNTMKKMQQLRMSYEDVQDIFRTGETIQRKYEPSTKKKHYHNQGLLKGFMYKKDKHSDGIIILGPWIKKLY